MAHARIGQKCSQHARIGQVVECRKCGRRCRFRHYTRGHICPECWRAYYRAWSKTPAGRAHMRRHTKWVRANYLGVRLEDGRHGYIRIEGKRSHPGSCEMCQRSDRRLAYHHWDNEDFTKGLWLCLPCHNIAEAVEKGIAERYMKRKTEVAQGIQTK